jgi:Ca-activated chloride channel family protein
MAGLTLQAPDRLWLLLLPALLAAGYLLAQGRRVKYVARFTNLELIDTVLPRGPGWRRHVPPVAMLFATAVMAFGLAHPSRLHRVARREGVVVLAVDVSPSMMATDVAPNREVAAQAAVAEALSTIPASIQVGLVSFAGTASVEVPPSLDRDAVRRAISHLRFRSYTSYTAAIISSLAAVAGAQASAAGIVMVSDGCPCSDPVSVRDQAIGQAAKDHVPVSVAIVGSPHGAVDLAEGHTPVPVDAPTLEHIAQATGGRVFHGATASKLAAIYRSIGTSVGVDRRPQDFIGWFLAVGLLLVVAGAALSLVWFSRIP